MAGKAYVVCSSWLAANNTWAVEQLVGDTTQAEANLAHHERNLARAKACVKASKQRLKAAQARRAELLASGKVQILLEAA